MKTEHHDLFGPVQGGFRSDWTPFGGALCEQATVTWSFVGQALSANIKRFRFDLGLDFVEDARWVTTWVGYSANNQVRLVHFDDGPTNVTEICVITNPGLSTPISQPVVIKDALNALRTAGVYKSIGFQVRGDALFAIQSSFLEITS